MATFFLSTDFNFCLNKQLDERALAGRRSKAPQQGI
jgi:hypothetical protein